jgi:hypothetical protein
MRATQAPQDARRARAGFIVAGRDARGIGVGAECREALARALLGIALQLPFPFEVTALRYGLMGSSP